MSEAVGLGEIVKSEVPSKKEVLTRDFLTAVISNPEFNTHISVLAQYAQRGLSESGFVVEDKSGIPQISKIIKAPRLGKYAPLHAHSIDLSKLLKTEEEYDEDGNLLRKSGYRKNIVMIIHSHPVLKGYKTEEIVKPSPADLEAWELQHQLFPHVIEGIVVPSKNEAQILFFQKDPAREISSHYQQIESGRQARVVLNIMRESGIRYDILRFDLKQESFPDEEKEKFLGFSE